VDLCLYFVGEDEEQLLSDGYDWTLPHVFQEKRHVEKVEGLENDPQCWRMKERVRDIIYWSVLLLVVGVLSVYLIFQMKTVSVALVMCLNVGVDPPGIVKMQPCARMECWVGKFEKSIKIYCHFKGFY